MRGFGVLLGRELRLAVAGGGDAAVALVFFVLVVVLFPLGIGPEPNVLARIGAGVVLVAAMLASLLALERLFQSDLDDGAHDLLATAPPSLELLALAKTTAHWLTTGLPLVALAPLMAMLMRMPVESIPWLMLALLLATPSLSLLGSIGAALTLGARRGGVLMAFLILPFFVPIVIFAASAVEAALTGRSPQANLLLLAGIGALALPTGPIATAAAIRLAVE